MNIKNVSTCELSAILAGNLDFVLERYVLIEDKLCKKPVYKFIDAYISDPNIPEFCLIYCEADDPDEIFVSFNSDIFESIAQKYNPSKVIRHGGPGGVESYYRAGGQPIRAPAGNIRLLTRQDKPDKIIADDYFEIIFRDFIERQIYRDCAVIAVTDAHDNFAGYLAYYGIAENIMDVSYIYVAENHRGKGYGKALLEFFAGKNAAENKISYYSYADGEISANLAKSCGFLPCAKRTETNA